MWIIEKMVVQWNLCFTTTVMRPTLIQDCFSRNLHFYIFVPLIKDVIIPLFVGPKSGLNTQLSLYTIYWAEPGGHAIWLMNIKPIITAKMLWLYLSISNYFGMSIQTLFGACNYKSTLYSQLQGQLYTLWAFNMCS